MQILQAGERKEFSLNNMKLDGFTVNITMTGNIFSFSPQNTSIDWTKTMLKVILKRDGQQFILIQDDLKTLGLSSNLYTMGRRAFKQDHGWHIPLVYSTTTVYGVTILPFDIELGGTIHLRATDELICELNLQNDFIASNINPAQTFVEIKPRKSIAFEKYVPYVRSYGIQAGERRRTFDLGNNITAVQLLNYDQATMVNPVVNTVTLTSSQFDETYSLVDLVNLRHTSRPDQGEEATQSWGGYDEFDQCYELVNNSELDKVKIDIQFNPANVIANNNLLVVRSAYTDLRTLIEHDANVQIAQNVKIAELKQNGENAKVTVPSA